MKFFSRLTKHLLVVGVALGVVSIANSVQAQNMKDGFAQTKAILGGKAFYSKSDAWVPLKVGDTLRSGTAVKTEKGAHVDFFLGRNGPVVRVTEDTVLNFDSLKWTKIADEDIIETKMDLKNGTILGNVKKLAAGSKYEVKIPAGVAGIRGTEYVVSANGRVTCVNGTMQVQYNVTINGVSSTITVNLNQGETFVPPTNEAQATALINAVNNAIQPGMTPAQQAAASTQAAAAAAVSAIVVETPAQLAILETYVRQSTAQVLTAPAITGAPASITVIPAETEKKIEENKTTDNTNVGISETQPK